MALKLRRGTDAERLSVTPEIGELVYTTDTKRIFVGDGATAGGNVVSGINDIVDDTSPQLGGNLDLNGNDITGTGNINITGTVTATGNINLGDGAGGDIISVGGAVNGNLTPDQHLVHDIGSTAFSWRNGYFSSLDVSGHIEADSIKTDIIATDSTVAYNADTNTFTGNFNGTLSGTFDGDINGSIFADDSTLVVDAINKNIIANNVDLSTITATNTEIDFVEPNSRAILRITRQQAGDLRLSAGFNQSYGQIKFSRNDDNGIATGVSISGGGNGFYIDPEGDGTYPESSGFTLLNDGDVGLGTYTPTAKLDVRGDAIITGTVSSSFVGSLASDNSTMVVDNNGTIVNLAFTGEVGNTPGDTGTVDSWLEVTVNGATKYIPLYD
jgi:hypothetical protein